MGGIDASTLALIIVGGIAALASPIAFAGYRWGKRVRAEDQAKEFGRLEGRTDALGRRFSDSGDGGDGRPSSVLISDVAVVKAVVDRIERRLGEVSTRTHDHATAIQVLQGEIKDVTEAVSRIERYQADNREAAKHEHVALKTTVDRALTAIRTALRRIDEIQGRITRLESPEKKVDQ